MRESTARLLFLVGMLLSFPAILAVTLVAVGSHGPSRRPQAARSVAAAPAPRARPPVQHASGRAASVPRPTSGGEAGVPGRGAAPAARPAQTDVALIPGPQAGELATLKRELRQQIDSLKDDRDAMVEALARSLARLTPEQAATQLAAMDADTAARTLVHFGEARRRQVLDHMPPAAARQARERLVQLAAR